MLRAFAGGAVVVVGAEEAEQPDLGRHEARAALDAFEAVFAAPAGDRVHAVAGEGGVLADGQHVGIGF